MPVLQEKFEDLQHERQFKLTLLSIKWADFGLDQSGAPTITKDANITNTYQTLLS